MSYSVEVDEGACAAHGDCVDVAPEVFELDDVARVIGTGPEDAAAGRRGGLSERRDPDHRSRDRTSRSTREAARGAVAQTGGPLRQSLPLGARTARRERPNRRR